MTSLRSTFVWLSFGAALAACTGGNPSYQVGYLASDKCLQQTDAASCGATTGCNWAAGATSGNAGTCQSNDPCLGLSKDACAADSGCGWSAALTLCPMGADCSGGGFCHGRDDNGGTCACVSPIACPANSDCAAVECDCASGGSGGGGACACACPPCAAGSSCEPCACNCGGGTPGCGSVGTCACACPDCADGSSCPPCACDCGSGGGTTVAGNTGSGTPGSNGVDMATTGPDDPPTCVCTCAACAPNTDCAPCDCSCPVMTTGTDGGTDGSTGCIPPAPPVLGGTPKMTPVVCPAIACASQPDCPNGTTTDSNGCPTCTCAP